MKRNFLSVFLMVLFILSIACFGFAYELEEHASGGTLDNEWIILGLGSGLYNDDVLPFAESTAPDADGYVLELSDRDKNYYGISGCCTTPTVWSNLTIDGYIYTTATLVDGAEPQSGFMFRVNPEVVTEYGRVILNLSNSAQEIKVQTYTGGWSTESFDIDNAWATTGWHHVVVTVSGVDSDEVTVTYDGNLLGTKIMSDLAPGNTLEAAGPIGIQVVHFKDPAPDPTPFLFDNILVEAPPSKVKDWDMY